MRKTNAYQAIFLAVISSLTVACSGGGGGGGVSFSDSGISYANTTVTISENSIKDTRQFQVVVTPKNGDNAAFNISNKYDLQIQFLPTSGIVRNLVQADFTQVGNTWVATITPDASADALFYLILNGSTYGNANLGDITTPKLTIDKWTECKDPSPDSVNTTQIWRKRGAYNLICDFDDIDRLYYTGANDLSGATISPVKTFGTIFDREAVVAQSANRQTAFTNSFTEDFVLMINVNNFTSSIYNIGLESAYNRFFTEYRTGRVYLNGKTTGTLVMGKTVVTSGEANRFNTNNIITGVPAGF